MNDKERRDRIDWLRAELEAVIAGYESRKDMEKERPAG